ncbi:hypothetical protein ESB00_14930 [Oleiharenicola lentus]|uniref:Glycosyltransferase family 1 protein n=1 Tax=Oleiharenicola lentus TaxID=2508720 RepID=A0A4Q1C3M6_9BACT|nr:hypothetical protein [Oleiharenicola lentus]RXK53004.1 hypothetical protein ESB00_14930 [Oleiharenicola lentus]
MRRIRPCYFNTWAGGLEAAADYVARIGSLDLRPLVANPQDGELLRKARLDCDWYAANARCFATMSHPQMEFLPAWVVGKPGVLDLAKVPREPGEERWLITMAHQPQALGDIAGRVFGLLAKMGVRHCFYAFDEASRFMSCFKDIAPHLDVLIHDESPLAETGRALLKPGCVASHRSWVANFAPGEAVFNEAPEEKIYFLGSQMGLTPHRQRQLEFLRRKFKDRLVASHDHSTPVDARRELNRYKVGLCPEGRKFTTPAMRASHTDRPFWSGCLGMVPVSENSKPGGRLEELHAAGLIVRYEHGDLESLAAACERGLALGNVERRKIYDHFNAHETVGAVVAEALAAA